MAYITLNTASEFAEQTTGMNNIHSFSSTQYGAKPYTCECSGYSTVCPPPPPPPAEVYRWYKFNNIEVTLGIGCSLNCRFCPQALLINKYGNNSAKKMSFSTFVHCTENVVKGGGIIFSGMSEPFLNEECASMIKHAYEEGFKVTLFTTLIGMNEKDFEQIKDINFDSLTLHIPDKENNSKFILNDKYWQMLEKFVSVVNVSAYSFHGTPHEKVFRIIPSSATLGGEVVYLTGQEI